MYSSIAMSVTALMLVPGTASAQQQKAAMTGTMIEQAIGKTLEVSYPDGGPTLTFDFEADGTFTAVFPGGVKGRGDYVADARHLCWITIEPAPEQPGQNTRCEANTINGRTVGQSWTVLDSHGDRPTLTIRPRRGR